MTFKDSYDKHLFTKFFYLANMCKLSYSDDKDIDDNHDVLHELTKSRKFFENKDTCAQCYIFNSQKSIFICFRGTSSIRDAFTDLKLFQTNFILPNIKVHRGFHKQFESLRDDINNHISDTILKNKNINTLCFTGHSLGGGLATIASIWFKYFYKHLNVECVTFGSPRCGNKNFVDFFQKNIDISYRIVNKQDPIQYVPMNPFYFHVCDSHTISNDIITIQKPVVGLMRLFNTLENLNYTDIVKPHRCDTYINFFQKFI